MEPGHSVTDAEVHRVTAEEGGKNVPSGRRATERRCNAWPAQTEGIGPAYTPKLMPCKLYRFETEALKVKFKL